MRICILTTSTTTHQMGGTEVHAETLAREASSLGHKVVMVTTGHPAGVTSEEKDGYTVVYLPGTRHTMSRREAPAWWRASAEKTAQMHAAGLIDVIWAENFAGLSCAAIPRNRRPPVISIVNGLALKGEISSNFRKISSPRELFYFCTFYAAQTVFYYIPWFRAMVRDSDMLVGVSHESSAALRSEFPGAASKVRTILNPVDTSVFAPATAAGAAERARLGIPGSAKVILMSGVIHKQKGMHLGLKNFIAIAGRFPEAVLLIAGDGPERKALQETAGRSGFSGRIVFCGMRENRDMPAVYNAADIYLNPTLRQEGLPMVILEAMACGLPGVISRIGGTGSTVIDGKSGFFVRPGDAEGFVQKLALLLSDDALRARMSAAARTRAMDVFNTEKVVGQYLSASAGLAGAGR